MPKPIYSLGAGDTSRLIQRSDYDGDCQACWYGDAHTLDYHDEQIAAPIRAEEEIAERDSWLEHADL